ncbi:MULTISPECIES: hypothetical protein [Rathayibacter]|uniref:Uncharacterized protein n=2 Tax=Rathayibacter festucae TaxID=110937 RepID=A0A3Q9V019_9MICO|nr:MULTISPECIES: hypothetical protein [Rathayibacter]AZZ53252.1 hypothetical protein C1I64_15215 [Rathayibacter festucae DSM 15932]MCJ1675410.1 hypothetical protein [Rathayibacter sp. VKM Ac-2929]MCJ1685399.1 hypothetical protein [Rathayibacter sp. VKM Ac-2928]MCJ1687206.1 hypothetical protein [Rathayibacter sp. VKM Ac-2927]MCJ1701931.1 hypothetical protein [Rathayibacter festucae]
MSDHNGTLFRRGGTVRFVRWVSSRDGGWAPEIIQGRYLERDDSGWLVEIEGTPTLLTKDDWAVYR